MAIPRRAPVVDRNGDEIGHTDAVLGDDEGNIFHGLAVNLKGLAGVVELPADRVTSITTERVATSLDPAEVDDLPDYEEQKWYEFGGISRLLKRATWKEDE